MIRLELTCRLWSANKVIENEKDSLVMLHMARCWKEEKLAMSNKNIMETRQDLEIERYIEQERVYFCVPCQYET